MTNKFKYSEHIFVSEGVYFKNGSLPIKLIYSGRSGELVAIRYNDIKLITDKKIPPLESKLFNSLHKAEIIIDNKENDLDAIIERNQKFIQNPNYLNFVILPSSFCNMGCSYCGQAHSKGAMNEKVVKETIARIESAIQMMQPQEVSVSWFGGEPLVGYSRILQISRHLIDIVTEKSINLRAKLVTNGSLLTMAKLIELHETCKIEEINLTFDGDADIHDKRRILKNGNDNFIKTTSLIQAALKEPRLKNLRYIFRTNIDKQNEAHVDQYIQKMFELGFNDKRIGFELKAVYPWSNDVSSVQLEKKHFAQLEVDWMLQLLRLGMEYTFLLKKNEVTCVAVSPYSEVISTNGKIFTCTEHPLVPQHELQDFVSSTNLKWENRSGKGKFDNFNQKILSKKIPCASCKLLGVCGGACPKHWDEGNIPCPSIKFNLQDRLNLVAVKMGYQVITETEFKRLC